VIEGFGGGISLPSYWAIFESSHAMNWGVHVLNLQAHFDCFPRFKSEVDDLDLASAARFGCLLERLVNQGAVPVGVVRTENRDRLIVLSQLVDKITRCARLPPFGSFPYFTWVLVSSALSPAPMEIRGQPLKTGSQTATPERARVKVAHRAVADATGVSLLRPMLGSQCYRL
jgi:hypothetical protein